MGRKFPAQGGDGVGGQETGPSFLPGSVLDVTDEPDREWGDPRIPLSVDL